MGQDYPPEWHASAAIPDLLQPGERLLWQGRPGPRRSAVPTVLRPALFGGAVLGTVLMGWALVDRDAHGNANPGLVVAAFVAWMIAALLALGANIAMTPFQRHHAYAVTDRRALFVEYHRRRLRVESYGPERITFVVTQDHGDGSADVVFREGPVLRHVPGFHWSPLSIENPIGFLGITDAAAAAAALTWLQSQRPVAVATPAWDAPPP